MTDIEYLNKSIREKIVERVKNGFFDGAGGYLKAMDYYAKGLISLDTVKAIEAEIEAWEMSKVIEPPTVEDVPTEEPTETEDETILDDEEGTKTEVEGTEEPTEIVEETESPTEGATNEEEQTAEPLVTE